jgi:hypothetical protein
MGDRNAVALDSQVALNDVAHRLFVVDYQDMLQLEPVYVTI